MRATLAKPHPIKANRRRRRRAASRVWYPGQYFDAETGLNYNSARDYEPGTGRYVESDPIGLDGGISTYGYTESSPLVWSDRHGTAQDPSSDYCKALWQKIQNIRKDIDKRYKELEEDSQGLPPYIGPGEKFRDTKRGHMTLINILLQRLRELEDQYDAECSGKSFCQRNPKTCEGAVDGVIAIGATAACILGAFGLNPVAD